MGKHTFLGSYTSWDQIPQPTSIVLGQNLRQNSKDTSTEPTPPKAPTGAHRRPAHGAHPQQKARRPRKR